MACPVNGGDMMGLTMLEMIDNRLANYFSQPELYDISPFSIENLRDCIIMFILKDAYYLTEPKQSLRENRGTDADDVRMRDSRNIAYAQHYRDLQYNHVKNDLGIEIPELLSADVETMRGKLQGHNITPMQYFELNTLADHPLLKAIVSKRICDVKKVSNTTFLEYMQDYDKLVSLLLKKLDGSDEDVIFGTIALFTLEWKYNVELFYSCAVNAEKAGTQEVPVHRLAGLCAELSIPLAPYFTQMLHTESRFVLHRLKLVPAVYTASESEWEEVKDKICHYQTARYYIEREIVRKWDMAGFFARYTTREQWAKFFREHYDLRQIYAPKEWNNKRIRYMRSIYSAMIKDQPTP